MKNLNQFTFLESQGYSDEYRFRFFIEINKWFGVNVIILRGL